MTGSLQLLARRQHAHEERIWHIEQIPQQTTRSLFTTCSADKTIHVWACDNDSIEPLNVQFIDPATKLSHNRTIRCLSFSPDGLLLATCGFDGQTILYQQKSNLFYQPITTLEGHENEVKSLAWTMTKNETGPPRYLLATCGRDKAVWIWQIEGEDLQLDCVAVLQEHGQDVKQVLWHPTLPTLLFSCSADDTIRLWKESDEHNESHPPGEWFLSKTLTQHQHIVWGMDISSDGRWLASVAQDGSLCVWDRELSWDCVFFISSLTILHQPLYTIAWQPSSDIFAIAGGDDTIYIYKWSPPSATLVCKYEQAHLGDVVHLSWGRDRHLFSVGDDLSIALWSLD